MLEQAESIAASSSTKSDLVNLGAVLGPLKADLEGAGYDVAKIQRDLPGQLESPAFMASFARLQALAKGAC